MFICFFPLVAAALSFGLTPLVRYVARWVGAVDQPGERKIHAVPIPRLGGVSVVVSALLTVLIVWKLERVTVGSWCGLILESGSQCRSEAPSSFSWGCGMTYDRFQLG